jgi:glyoxylase-like metal-dependent hydrolase (beta-lactamase superfamily II)
LRVEGRVRLLYGPRRGRFPESTCPLVEYRGSRILIDTGCLGPSTLIDVDAVIYTHHHPDHIRGSHLLHDEVVEYSPIGESAYRSLRDLARRFAPPIWREWTGMAQTYIGALRVPGGEYYEPYEDVCFRGICLKTQPAPGHINTHTIIELPGSILHIGDIDLTSFGPWYGNPESDPLAFLADIELASAWNARAYTTSHKPEVIEAEEAQRLLKAYSLRLLDHITSTYKAYASLGRPSKPEELVGRGVIYRRIPGNYSTIFKYFEYNMILKITHILVGAGCLKRIPEGYTATEYCPFLEKLRDRIEPSHL